MKKSFQLPLNFPAISTFGSDNFYVTSSNQLAVNIIDSYPNWTYFAQLIYGEHGCGKSHLASIMKEKEPSHLFLPGEEITDFLQIDKKAVIVDGIDKADEKYLFHLYNIMKDKGFLLLTSRRPVNKIGIRLPDLKSRLLTVPAIEISAPGDDLVLALLVKNFQDHGADISNDVLQFLLKNIERSYLSIQELVEKANYLSISYKKKITIPLIKEALETAAI